MITASPTGLLELKRCAVRTRLKNIECSQTHYTTGVLNIQEEETTGVLMDNYTKSDLLEAGLLQACSPYSLPLYGEHACSN